MAVDITKHMLVPKQTKISDSEKQKVLQQFNLSGKEMPKIRRNDPSISKLSVKEGDLVRVERESLTSGKSFYYRLVVE